MAGWQETFVGRRVAGTVAIGALLVTGGVALVTAPVAADVGASGQRCFGVSGDAGDAAIVNLTPVFARTPGFGLLVSANIKSDVPDGSNVNFGPGTVDPNVAVAQIGGDGQVCFQNSVHGAVDLIADHLGTINGSAYRAATSTGAPDRRVDTRFGIGGGRVSASGQLCFDVVGAPGDAAIVNITPIGAERPGFGILVSSDIKTNVPDGSNVNFGPGTVDPNVAVAQIGGDGQVCFQNSVHGSVDVIADHLGTIAGPAYRSATQSGAPNRRVDTRFAIGGSRLVASGQVCFDANGEPGDAAIVNLTPIDATSPGFGLLVSSDIKTNVPEGSNVNFGPGTVDPNVAISPIGDDGQVCFQNSVHGGVDVIADHLGTITGGAYSPATGSGAPERRVDSRFDVDDPRPECEGSDSLVYDHALSRTMMGLSSRAYEIDPGDPTGRTLDTYGTKTVHAEELMSCWTLVDAMRGTSSTFGQWADTELIIARNEQTNDVAVAFRGTEFLSWDVINDISSARRSFTLPNGRTVQEAAHDGFVDGYSIVRNRLLTALRNQHRSFVPDARIYFTGHSLGGALATLASLDLVDEMEDLGYATDEVVTYTFGAPRSMSRELADEHARFVPQTYAIASPMDPVPQVPFVVGSNHYSHVRNMIVLNGSLFANDVRLDQGDGRNHRGCLASFPASVPALTANFLTIHARAEYDRRLALRRVGAPRVWITISAPGFPDTGGHNRLHWDTPREGPCDEVGLFRTSGTLPDAGATPIVDRMVDLDINDQHTTLTGKGDDFWVGYINIFGELSSKAEYVPTTPSVWLSRKDRAFPQQDDLQFNWSVSDPGTHDLIVLYDRDPCLAGPSGYYRSLVGRVEAEAKSNSPEVTLVNVGNDPNDWWVAYVMIDDDGRQRILSRSRGFSGSSSRCL